MTAHTENNDKQEIEKILKVAKSSLKLSYPDEYPAKHDKLHIANVTLEGLEEYERFATAQIQSLLNDKLQSQAVKHAVIESGLDMQITSLKAKIINTEKLLNDRIIEARINELGRAEPYLLTPERPGTYFQERISELKAQTVRGDK